MGPGPGALPGFGCGKAVDAAVWNVTLPSTFLHCLLNVAVQHRDGTETLKG